MIKLKDILNEITIDTSVKLVKGEYYTLSGNTWLMRTRENRKDHSSPAKYLGYGNVLMPKGHVGNYHEFETGAGWRDIIIRFWPYEIEKMLKDGEIKYYHPSNDDTINEITVTTDPFGLSVGMRYDIEEENGNLDCFRCAYRGLASSGLYNTDYASFTHQNGVKRAYTYNHMNTIIEKGLINPSRTQDSINEISVDKSDEFGFIVGNEYLVMNRSGENVGDGTYKTYMGAHPMFDKEDSDIAAVFKPSYVDAPWRDDYRTLWFRPFHLGPDGQYRIIPA